MHSLPLSKLTNLSSKRKRGWFCRLKKKGSVNDFYLLLVFLKIKIMEFKSVHEVFIIKLNIQRQITEICLPLLLTSPYRCACAVVYAENQKFQQKVPTWKKTTWLFSPLGVITTPIAGDQHDVPGRSDDGHRGGAQRPSLQVPTIEED